MGWILNYSAKVIFLKARERREHTSRGRVSGCLDWSANQVKLKA
jgi:hypothetical protein